MREIFILALSACVLSAVLCAVLIPVLKKKRAGQYILGYVKEHLDKSGTPTMGGLAFAAAAVIVAAAAGLFADRLSAVSVTLGLAFLAVGFIDDYLKFRFPERKENFVLYVCGEVSYHIHLWKNLQIPSVYPNSLRHPDYLYLK